MLLNRPEPRVGVEQHPQRAHPDERREHDVTDHEQLRQSDEGLHDTDGELCEQHDQEDADAPEREVADERLQTLTPEHRTALLLMLMEGFSPHDVSAILQVSVPVVEARFRAAQDDIERQLATKVLIIEDEPIVALDLERLVQDLGHMLAGVAATRSEAVKLALEGEPGLVLADVRLADGSSGLDAVTDILQSFDIPVIFITAFPERLLTGERPEPAFLVTKPFHEEAVKALIGQALFFHKPQRRGVA